MNRLTTTLAAALAVLAIFAGTSLAGDRDGARGRRGGGLSAGRTPRIHRLSDEHFRGTHGLAVWDRSQPVPRMVPGPLLHRQVTLPTHRLCQPVPVIVARPPHVLGVRPIARTSGFTLVISW